MDGRQPAEWESEWNGQTLEVLRQGWHVVSANSLISPMPVTIGFALSTKEAFRRVFPGVMVAMFLAAADQTILASALPTIASTLGGLADLSWVVVAYLLAATVAAPLYGHLGDHFGRQRMLLVALAVFTAASLACAVAPTLLLLIVARAIQGLGGGGLMTMAQALIGEHVSPRERGRFAGYFATVFALASTSGPVLGAYLTEHLTWRAVFAVNLPLGLLAAVLAMRIPRPPATKRAGPFRLDVAGAILFSTSTVALLFALSSGGHRFAWTSWPLVALVVAAVLGYVGLLAWERRVANPVIPVRFLRNPAIVRSDAVVVCFGATLFSTILYLPLYLQFGRGLSVGTSGLLLLPVTLSMVASSAITGRLVTRTGLTTIFPQCGLALATVALIALAFAADFATTWIVPALTMIVGVGLGMVMPPTQVTVQLAAGRESLGAATGSIALSRALGGAIGVAIVGAILYAQVGQAGDVFAAMLAQVVEGGPAFISRMPPVDRDALGAQIGHAYRSMFLVIAIFTVVGALIARTIPKPDWTK